MSRSSPALFLAMCTIVWMLWSGGCESGFFPCPDTDPIPPIEGVQVTKEPPPVFTWEGQAVDALTVSAVGEAIWRLGCPLDENDWYETPCILAPVTYGVVPEGTVATTPDAAPVLEGGRYYQLRLTRLGEGGEECVHDDEGVTHVFELDGDDDDDDDCSPGTEGCECIGGEGGDCIAPLVCLSGHCVDDGHCVAQDVFEPEEVDPCPDGYWYWYDFDGMGVDCYDASAWYCFCEGADCDSGWLTQEACEDDHRDCPE